MGIHGVGIVINVLKVVGTVHGVIRRAKSCAGNVFRRILCLRGVVE